MTRNAVLFAAVALLVIRSGPACAQLEATDIVGERVRLMIRESRDTKIVGKVLRVDGDVIVLREHVGASETRVRIPDLARLDVSTRKRRGPMKNAAIGFVSGTMAGVAYASVCEYNDEDCGWDAIAGGSVLAVGGALVGFFYGTTHADTWEKADLTNLGVALSISPTGRLLLTASF